MATSLEDQLIDDLASFADRPYDFMQWAWPWGEVGTELEKRAGLEPWQAKVAKDLQDGLISASEAFRIAVRSGHGVGKSAFVSMLLWWALSTAVDTRGRVTANTEKQLLRTLWPEVAKWHRLFIARSFFKVTATAMMAADPEHERNWRIDAIPWSEDNPEAFAGLHNYGKRIIVVCDEASGIPDVIWEVLDGATLDADTQIIWLATGNPTRATGRFRECFETRKDEWHGYKVDSREVSFTNKVQIDRAIARYGIEDDYIRVRYLGEFPLTDSSALFTPETLQVAMKREVASQPWEPLILGVDVARFGPNESVLFFRRGRDARAIPLQRYRGLSTMELGYKVAAAISEHGPDGVFIDEGGVGGGVIDFVRHLGHSATGVIFQSVKDVARPQGVAVANKRAEMYVRLRDWIREGGCLPNDEDLYTQLVPIEYFFRRTDSAIQLIPKEELADPENKLVSPDLADALAITFAFPVSQRGWRNRNRMAVDYDPLSFAQLPSERELYRVN